MSRTTKPGRVTRAIVACSLLLGAACSGPLAPLEVGMNARSVDLLLGERVRLVTGGPIFPPIRVGPFPPVGATPRPRKTGSPPPAACPFAPPDAPYLNQVTAAAELPPAEGTYEYRTNGRVTSGDTTTSLPPITTRTVSNVRAEQTGSYTYDVVAGEGATEALATFRIVPRWFPAPPPAGGGDTAAFVGETATGERVPRHPPVGSRVQPGMYLVRVESADQDFRVADPGIKIVDFPVKRGETYRTAGTDGPTTLSFTSTVAADRPRVDACGSLIDVHRVDLVGQVARQTPGGIVVADFTSSYGIATQFGGLIVWERAEVSSGQAERTIEATINRVPAPAKEPS